jgi:hypothetical protein
MIVLALAAGAAAGLKPAAEQAVRDAYAGIKRLIQDRYAQIELAPLEQKPESEAKRASLTEDLEEAGAGNDEELLAQARALVAVVEQHDAAAAAAVGVDLEKIKAGFLRIGSVDAEGTGVRVKEGEFEGGIDIGDVRAGKAGPEAANPR